MDGFIDCYQYVGWSSEDAVKHYLTRISSRIPQFQTMEEKDLNYIKVTIRPLTSALDIDFNSYLDDKCRRKTNCQQL